MGKVIRLNFACQEELVFAFILPVTMHKVFGLVHAPRNRTMFLWRIFLENEKSHKKCDWTKVYVPLAKGKKDSGIETDEPFGFCIFLLPLGIKSMSASIFLATSFYFPFFFINKTLAKAKRSTFTKRYR